MRVLVNYIYHKNADKFEIQSGRYVMADMKVAVYETEMEINEPLVVPIKGIMTVVDKATYCRTNRKFRFTVNEDGSVKETPQGGFEIWLPINTDVSKLRYENGNLFLVEEKEEPEEEQTKDSENN